MTAIRVVIQQPNLPKYRLAIYQALAARPGIELTMAYGAETGERISRASGFAAHIVPMRAFNVAGHMFRWHWPQWHYADRRLADVLVLSWDVHYLTLLPALLRARYNGVGTILWGHGYSKTETPLRFKARSSVIGLADALMFYNHRGASAFLNQGWDARRAFVALNSLDQTPIAAARQHWLDRPGELAAFRSRHDIDQGPVLLFCARLHPARRLELLVDAAAILRESFANLKVILIGDGPAEAPLRKQIASLGIEKQIRFQGAIYDELELAPWFLSADAFCFPSFIGLSVLHAMGYGLPVITCDQIQAQGPEIEALTPGENGLFYRAGDAGSLAEVLRGYLSDGEARKRMAANALATVQERFSVGRMVDQMEAAVRYAYGRSGGGH